MEKEKNTRTSERSEHALTSKKTIKFFKMLKNVMASYELTMSHITGKKLVVTLNCFDTTYNFNQVLRNRVASEKWKQYAIVLFSDNRWESVYRTDEIDMKDHRNIMDFVLMSNWIGLNKEVPHTVVVCYCKVSPAKQTEIVFEVERISVNDQRKIEKKIQQAHHQQSLIEAAKIDAEITKLKNKKKKIEDQMKRPFNRKNYNAHLKMLADTDARETELAVQSSKQVSEEKLRMRLGENSTGQHSGPSIKFKRLTVRSRSMPGYVVLGECHNGIISNFKLT